MTMSIVRERCPRCSGTLELREDYRHKVVFLSCISCSCRRYFEQIERLPEAVDWVAWWRRQRGDRAEREWLRGGKAQHGKGTSASRW
jgi:hypothetical protein